MWGRGERCCSLYGGGPRRAGELQGCRRRRLLELRSVREEDLWSSTGNSVYLNWTMHMHMQFPFGTFDVTLTDASGTVRREQGRSS